MHKSPPTYDVASDDEDEAKANETDQVWPINHEYQQLNPTTQYPPPWLAEMPGGPERWEVEQRPGESRLALLRRRAPNAPWDNPTRATKRASFGPPPTVPIGSDIEHTMIGLHPFEPILWYPTQLRWGPHGKNTPQAGGTAWAELALDFQLATHIPPKRPGRAEQGDLAEQAELFAAACKRVGILMRGDITTCGPPKKRVYCLMPMEFRGFPGINGKAALLHRERVTAHMVERQLKVGGQYAAGDLRWLPKWEYRLPAALWKPNLSERPDPNGGSPLPEVGRGHDAVLILKADGSVDKKGRLGCRNCPATAAYAAKQRFPGIRCGYGAIRGRPAQDPVERAQ